MPVATGARTRSDRSSPSPAPRTVCLTFGPADDLGHLLRCAAEVLDVSGVIPSAMEPSADAQGAWLRITCDVDPGDVATLVALPAIADHHEPQVAARCPACDLRAYLAA